MEIKLENKYNEISDGIIKKGNYIFWYKAEVVDKFNICQYFPGYIRNEKLWNQIKEGYFTAQQLKEIFYAYNSKNQLKLEF